MTKTCKQCGVIKPLGQFRNYYGGRKGTYTICKTCEKINSRVKYLEGKSELQDKERGELQSIYTLWDEQRKLGYQPPRTTTRGRKPVVDTVLEMLEAYKAHPRVVQDATEATLATPPELLKWLSEELTEDPDYYLDDVYDKLRSTYKPVTHIDEASMRPVYDETYASILDTILERFYAYEEEYYEKTN